MSEDKAANAATEFNLAQNPLVTPPALPNGAPALQQIKDEHLEPAFDWALEQSKKNIDAITSNPDAPTFENTIEALEFASQDLRRMELVFENLMLMYSNDEKSRIEEEVVSEKVIPHKNNIFFNQDLFSRVKEVYEHADRSRLSVEQKTLLEETYTDFAAKGADLEPELQEEFSELSQRLAVLTSQYRKNVQKDQDSYELLIDDINELKGVPPIVISSLAQAAKKAGHEGKWMVKLNPTCFQVIRYADNRDLRETIHKAFAAIGNNPPNDNKPLIKEILEIREQKAQLLGYQHHGDFVTSRRMAGSADTVLDFLEKNRAVYHAAAQEEFDELEDYALATGEISQLEAWDWSYYSAKLEQEQFDLDPQELQQYFELGKVVDGLFKHAEKLFNLSFVEANDKYERSSDDMNAYEVFDNDKGELIGVFYTDYYQREGKKAGAWASTFRDRGDYEGVNQVPIVTNCCNYPEPTDDFPTLLTFDQVTTAFHEFGHALHALLGQGRFPRLNGFNVKWDFVEFPSQIQEQWAAEQEVLKSFAVHHETGEPISEELIEKNKAASQFHGGTAGLGQTRYALLDMIMHTTPSADIGDIVDFENQVNKSTSFFGPAQDAKTAAFNHIFGSADDGYDAGYYSYKWAEVIDADGFTAFQKNGLYDEATADALKVMYSSGSTVPPDELFHKFMGRDPDPSALFEREGVAHHVNHSTAPDAPQHKPK